MISQESWWELQTALRVWWEQRYKGKELCGDKNKKGRSCVERKIRWDVAVWREKYEGEEPSEGGKQVLRELSGGIFVQESFLLRYCSAVGFTVSRYTMVNKHVNKKHDY